MTFNKDYKEFLDHLEKSNQKAQIKTELSKCERTAILLFVAYLNIRHQNLPHNKALHSDRTKPSDYKTAIEIPLIEAHSKARA